VEAKGLPEVVAEQSEWRRRELYIPGYVKRPSSGGWRPARFFSLTAGRVTDGHIA